MRSLSLLGLWASLLFFQIAYTCETDDDCSLNGLCVRRCSDEVKVCKCDPGWWGDDCGRLDLAPATRWTGYNYTNFTLPDYYKGYGNSSWCGNIIQDRQDKKLFHLIGSQFGHGCGLGGWRPHSFVFRAESRTGPQGPYHWAQNISSTFRHNPYPFWSEADQKYLMYTIGVDAEEPADCKSISK